MKYPEPEDKAQRKFDYKNHDEITMRRNYYRKLSASIYCHAKNVGIIGILVYPTSIMTKVHHLYFSVYCLVSKNKSTSGIAALPSLRGLP